ncbi:MAG TPA: cation:dicarboxylase symporter family transporter, partial [Halomonas sp.]|nr:cation:dicarboxylase symporter family transporter [Halomonas sp.]
MSTLLTPLWHGYRDASLILRVSIALVLGVVVGLVGGPAVAEWLAPLGELLMRLLKFIILPIVLFTLMSGVNQGAIGSLGRIGRKVFLYYLATSTLAIVVGLAVATLLSPGEGMSLQGAGSVSVPDNPGILSVVLGIVPNNIVAAFAEQDLLGIIFTALVFGLAVSKMRQSESQAELGERLYGLIEALNTATLRVMDGILHVVPVGVFAIVTNTVADQGLATLLSLGDMVVVLYLALAAQLLVYLGLLKGFGVSARAFFREARTPMATAFATQSSAGTLPLTLGAASRLGLPRSL